MTKNRWHYILVALMMLVLSSGCLQSAGSGADITSPKSLPRSTNTPLPTLTPSPGPTATPMVITEQVEVTSVQAVQPSPTSTPAQIAQAQSEDSGIVSEQSTEGVVQPETGQQDQGVTAQQQQGPTPTLDPLYVQATEFVLEATQEAENMTATAIGPVQPVPTFTPTPDPLRTATPTPLPTSGPVAPGQDCIHEVSAGENLFRLSLRYGVTVNEIARASGVQNVERIAVGQKLTIPGCGTTGVTPPPTSVPTPSRTPVGGAGTGTGSTGGTTAGTTYMVQQGDTLFEISLRFGVPVNDIVAANPNITNPDVIDFNEEIVIPGV